MLRSMFAAVSGLRSHQTMMDVVGNNIANVNTAGFKSSRVTFQEALIQVLRGASRAAPAQAGTNPLQTGLGTTVAAVDGVFTQGASQVTGRSTDLAIQGDGFFVVERGGDTLYTRSGAFSFDELGNLTTPTGQRVQGWLADPATNAIDYNAPLTDVVLPIGQINEPLATTTIDIGGNLPADGAVGETVNTSITVYDSLGNPQDVAVAFEKTADNAWDLTVTYPAGTTPATSTSSITFDTDGTLLTPASGDETFTGVQFPGGPDPQDLTLKFDGPSPLVQFGGTATAEATSQDGSAIGYLRDFNVGADGTISGRFSNGLTKVLGAVAVATFNNPGGLVREGESTFSVSVNSGQPLVGQPGSGNRGLLTAGALEMSNVDLAQEFTNLIIAQRGFQANSRGISTSDEMLQELVNLKR